MKKFTLVFFLALMVVLTACNSGGSTTKTYTADLRAAAGVTSNATGSVTAKKLSEK
jgi:uncharacterized lipoprotein YehR (DUF1307 family)